MGTLTEAMIEIIRGFSAGSVATIDTRGNPAVSPKATFLVLDHARLAFGDIRSPSTVANLKERPQVEVVFTDILSRRAVRVAGTAEVVGTDDPELRPMFESRWPEYVDTMQHFVVINVERAELVLSPAYDMGGTGEVLRRTNLDRLIERTYDRAQPIAVNHLDQPVGLAVPAATPARPSNDSMEGRYCLIEALDHRRHGPELDAAYRAAPGDGDWTYLPYGPWSAPQEFTAWVRQVEHQPDPMFFAIVDTASGRCGGVASYLRVDPAAASIEVGHIHLARSLQRTRAATEAMHLLMGQVFDAGYRRYEWKCDALNGPSRAAATRLGFRYEGTFRQATRYKGRNRDTAWYSIIDGEWPELDQEYRRWLHPDNFDRSGRQRSSLDCRR